MNATEIITDALRLAGGLGLYQALAGEQVTPALRTLNNMVRKWQADPYNLWARKETTLFLAKGSESYLLGNASTDAHWTQSWSYTLLNGAASSGATSITVDSYSGMAKDDFIGIELSDGTRQWTTIKTTPSTTTVSLSAALSGAASDNATVFFYTTRVERPLRVLHARRREYNGSDVPVEIISLNEYFDTPSKSNSGTPVNVAYDPLLTSGKLYVWQPGSVKTVLGLSVKAPFVEFSTVSDSPDFPEEWYETLVYNLADRLEPSYRILSADRRRDLKQDAAVFKAENLMYDHEDASIRFTV